MLLELNKDELIRLITGYEPLPNWSKRQMKFSFDIGSIWDKKELDKLSEENLWKILKFVERKVPYERL